MAVTDFESTLGLLRTVIDSVNDIVIELCTRCGTAVEQACPASFVLTDNTILFCPSRGHVVRTHLQGGLDPIAIVKKRALRQDMS